MAEEVYGSTTAPNPKSSWIRGPSEPLEKLRCGVKGCQVLLSFVAFVLEEAVHSCVRCSALYFFEFVSCSSFLFTLLLLVLLYSFLRDRVGVACWPKVDFGYSSVIFVLFLTSSFVFACSNGGTALEKSAVAFGFLASLAFLVDVVLFWKSSGFPFLKDRKPTPSNGGVAADGAPETAKLNAPE